METKSKRPLILIVDDDKNICKMIEASLRKERKYDIQSALSGEACLRILREEIPDLIMLDIQMPELSGIEMLKSLYHPPSVIFTTAYRDHAVEAFELDVIDYLVKPISLERLVKSVNRYHDRRSQQEQEAGTDVKSKDRSITIYADKKNHRVHTSSILYIEGLKDYARIHTDHGRLVTRQTMKSLEDILPPEEFIRVHRSFIIPIQRLDIKRCATLRPMSLAPIMAAIRKFLPARRLARRMRRIMARVTDSNTGTINSHCNNVILSKPNRFSKKYRMDIVISAVISQLRQITDSSSCSGATRQER